MRTDPVSALRLQRRNPASPSRKAAAALLIAALGPFPTASAQWKPAGQVEIVVPNSPGGGNDGVARLIQKVWKDRQLVAVASVVANKPGGAGNVTLNYLAQKPGDAHFMAIVSVTQQLNYIAGTSTVRHRDFTPLAVLLGDYVAFAVRADSPIRTGKDLLERLKKDPASASVGVTGIGGNNHIALILAARSAGADAKKIKAPVFQSSGDSITALLGGHIDVHAGGLASLVPQLEDGKLRIIALSSEQRLGGPFAQIPTWKEQGINGTFNTWRGVWGPKGMTADQVAYWDQVFAQLAQAEEWKQELEKRVWVNDYRNSKDTARYLETLHAEMRTVMKEIGLAKNLD